MANRAVNDGEPGASREVFELDKDERWLARLEQARARREIALREKAAGKAPPKKRLKPWETDEVAGKAPIEPIIQERDSDRVDFADRVETMRKATSRDPSIPPKNHNWARRPDDRPNLVDVPARPGSKVEAKPPRPVDAIPIEAYTPPSPDDFDEILTNIPKRRSDSGKISLVLDDAPAVSDLASRYAATLEPDPAPVAEPEPVTEPVPEPEVAEERPRSRRPWLLAFSALILAIVPFATKAPPLNVGPSAPLVRNFSIQPALGVTWSMQQRPVETRSGEWTPRTLLSPASPADPVDWKPADFIRKLPGMALPLAGGDHGPLEWSSIPLINSGKVASLVSPSMPGDFSATTGARETAAAPSEITKRPLKLFGNVPAKPRPPVADAVQPDAAPEDASLIAPPAPVLANPLRLTILSPELSDKRIAATIAEDIPQHGHEVVDVREVPFSIKSRNLRYFFDRDRRDAAHLAKLYDAELRDFTWYRPKPAEGTAELWLSGKPAVRNPVRKARPLAQKTEALEPPAPMRVFPVETPRRKTLLGRLFGGSGKDGRDQSYSNSDDDQVYVQRDVSTTDAVDANDSDAGAADSDTTDETAADSSGTTGSAGNFDTDEDGTDTADADAGSTDAGGADAGASEDTSGSTDGGDSGSSDEGDDSTSGNGNGNGNSGKK